VSAFGVHGLQAEVCDWRRFAPAVQMTGFVGPVNTDTPQEARPVEDTSPRQALVHLHT
jgi:hypothetical protein